MLVGLHCNPLSAVVKVDGQSEAQVLQNTYYSDTSGTVILDGTCAVHKVVLCHRDASVFTPQMNLSIFITCDHDSQPARRKCFVATQMGLSAFSHRN